MDPERTLFRELAVYALDGVDMDPRCAVCASKSCTTDMIEVVDKHSD